jgi:hypothetical protein
MKDDHFRKELGRLTQRYQDWWEKENDVSPWDKNVTRQVTIAPTQSLIKTKDRSVARDQLKPIEMLAARFGLAPGRKLPFEFVHCHKHVTIEDDGALFPSDTLMTQLRMIKG